MEQEFEWDPHKAITNFEKHKVRFADCVTVFMDDMAITIEDEHPYEERFITIGMDAQWRLLVVVYTWRDNRIRLISARKANVFERGEYET